MQENRLKRKEEGDRFIPLRKMNTPVDYSMDLWSNQTTEEVRCGLLKEILPHNNGKLLNFSLKQNKKTNLPVINNKESLKTESIKIKPKLIKKAEKTIIEAPGFKNDYYLNLLDAHSENLIGVVLSSSVFLLRRTKKYFGPILLPSLQENESGDVTSLTFDRLSESNLAFGNHYGQMKVHNWEKDCSLGVWHNHSRRIGALQFSPVAKGIIATGSKDAKVSIADTRHRGEISSGIAHSGEVCGIKWNPNGSLLASGGNDNLVHVWDIRKMQIPITKIESHTAAVRALDWCPWEHNMLASGGGSGDTKLIITNVDKSRKEKEMTTGSQVCAIAWDEGSRGIFAAHGFSKYQISYWNYDKSVLCLEFVGHRNRVLSMISVGTNGTILTGSADETLRLWQMNSFTKQFVKNDSQISHIVLR